MDCDKKQTLAEKANEPRSVSGDQGTWVNHSLREQIELDRYEASKKAKSRLRSIYGNRYVPPSARGQ